MLKGLDPILTAELLFVLKAMGHGDDIVLCDRNHPASTLAAKTTHGKLVSLFGADLARASEAVLSVFPLDTFVDEPVMRMKVIPTSSCPSTTRCKRSSIKPKVAPSQSVPMSGSIFMRPRPKALPLFKPLIRALMAASFSEKA